MMIPPPFPEPHPEYPPGYGHPKQPPLHYQPFALLKDEARSSLSVPWNNAVTAPNLSPELVAPQPKKLPFSLSTLQRQEPASFRQSQHELVVHRPPLDEGAKKPPSATSHSHQPTSTTKAQNGEDLSRALSTARPRVQSPPSFIEQQRPPSSDVYTPVSEPQSSPRSHIAEVVKAKAEESRLKSGFRHVAAPRHVPVMRNVRFSPSTNFEANATTSHVSVSPRSEHRSEHSPRQTHSTGRPSSCHGGRDRSPEYKRLGRPRRQSLYTSRERAPTPGYELPRAPLPAPRVASPRRSTASNVKAFATEAKAAIAGLVRSKSTTRSDRSQYNEKPSAYHGSGHHDPQVRKASVVETVAATAGSTRPPQSNRSSHIAQSNHSGQGYSSTHIREGTHVLNTVNVPATPISSLHYPRSVHSDHGHHNPQAFQPQSSRRSDHGNEQPQYMNTTAATVGSTKSSGSARPGHPHSAANPPRSSYASPEQIRKTVQENTRYNAVSDRHRPTPYELPEHLYKTVRRVTIREVSPEESRRLAQQSHAAERPRDDRAQPAAIYGQNQRYAGSESSARPALPTPRPSDQPAHNAPRLQNDQKTQYPRSLHDQRATQATCGSTYSTYNGSTHQGGQTHERNAPSHYNEPSLRTTLPPPVDICNQQRRHERLPQRPVAGQTLHGQRPQGEEAYCSVCRSRYAQTAIGTARFCRECFQENRDSWAAMERHRSQKAMQDAQTPDRSSDLETRDRADAQGAARLRDDRSQHQHRGRSPDPNHDFRDSRSREPKMHVRDESANRRPTAPVGHTRYMERHGPSTEPHGQVAGHDAASRAFWSGRTAGSSRRSGSKGGGRGRGR